MADEVLKPSKPKKADAEDEAIANPGYNYWHGKVPKGEGAAPAPVPQQVETAGEVTRQMVDIDSFMFLEEDDVRGCPTARSIQPPASKRSLRRTAQPLHDAPSSRLGGVSEVAHGTVPRR